MSYGDSRDEVDNQALAEERSTGQNLSPINFPNHVAQSNLLDANRLNRELTAKLNSAMYVLSQIITDLPIQRDWLNPDVEREARRVLGRPRA